MRRTDGIDVLGLSRPAYNCLKRHGIRTVGELVAMSSDDLLGLYGLGAKTLGEIQTRLKEVRPLLDPPGGYVARQEVILVAKANGASPACIEAIEKMTGADVERVKRSRWIRISSKKWICADCGGDTYTSGWEDPLRDLGMEHCPKCGADMRKRRKGDRTK